MTTQIVGTHLTDHDRRHVLASYVHRFTKEHRPAWAKTLRPDGRPYPVQFASDSDWLAHTVFAVRKDGRLDRRVNQCTSTPTWPDGKGD